MPSKNSKTKRKKRHRKVDPVRVQVSVQTKLPPGATVTKSLVNQAIERWAETGRTPKWLKIAAVEWQNPGRVTKKLRNWRRAETPTELEEARTSLHLARLLRGRHISFR